MIFIFRKDFTLSKTEEYGSAIDSEVPTGDPNSDEEEADPLVEAPPKKPVNQFKPLTGFAWVRPLQLDFSFGAIFEDLKIFEG